MTDPDTEGGAERADQAERLMHMRLIVSADALISVNTACRLIGGREARTWLEKHVTIRFIAGQRKVLWRDVIEASNRTMGLEKQAPKADGSKPRVRMADV